MARILVVDDQPDSLLEMRMLLEAAGHETVLAADAERAVERLADGRLDLVILDIGMAVGDGWNVLHMAGRAVPVAPVLVVSDRANAAQVDHARHLGAVGYLRKDELSGRLVDVVAATLG